MMDQILAGLSVALQPGNLLAVIFGTSLGIIFGSLPGLTATMGVALMIPITFGMNPVTGLITLGGIYTGAIYGGSISAILLHTPGTPSSAATIFDGYEMCKKGEAGKALAVATISSAIGGVVGALFLLFIAPPLARFSLRFGPPEYFAVALFGLTIICALTAKSLVKGLIAGLIGLLIGTIGMDPVTGYARFTFGRMEILEGIALVPALIGLFSISQILILTETALKKTQEERIHPISRIFISLRELKTMLVTILRSSLIGTFVGLIPGAGGDIASFIGYNEAMRFSKNKEKFGTGWPEGVAASEAANNGVTGGSLIPLLTLGVPGNAVSAVFLGGLLIQGLRPGPALFVEHGSITFAFIMGLLLAKFALFFLGIIGCKLFVHVVRVSDSILIPLIFSLSVIGSFAIRNSLFDVFIMFACGILGYLMRRAKFHPAPVVLAIILGPIAERNLRRMLIMGLGVQDLLTRPISLVLVILSIISIAAPLIVNWREKRLKKETT